MHYKINTYGCQMNVHESERIAHSLEKDIAKLKRIILILSSLTLVV